LQLNNFLGVLDGLLVPQKVQSLLLELLGPDRLLVVDVRPLILHRLLLLNLEIRRDLLEEIVEAVAELVVFLVVDGRKEVRVGFLGGAEEGISEFGLLGLGGHGVLEEEGTGGLGLGQFLESLQLWVGEQV